MQNFKIGVMVDSFRRGVREGLTKARDLGAEGVQIYAVNGEMAPENLSRSQRKEILDFARSNGLKVAALCGDLGGHGFRIAKDNPVKIEKSKRIMDLALDLECNIVTTHIGVIPSNENDPKRDIMMNACRMLGEYGDETGAFFAVETGPERAEILKGFIESLGSKGVRVNFDPANLVMVTGEDPVEAVGILKDYIVHTHAKDGIMLKQTNPEFIYNFFAEGGIEDMRLEDYFQETPLGAGNVNFPIYLKKLAAAGYNGFLTIEREAGRNPEKDIGDAVKFLKNILLKMQEGWEA